MRLISPDKWGRGGFFPSLQMHQLLHVVYKDQYSWDVKRLERQSAKQDFSYQMIKASTNYQLPIALALKPSEKWGCIVMLWSGLDWLLLLCFFTSETWSRSQQAEGYISAKMLAEWARTTVACSRLLYSSNFFRVARRTKWEISMWPLVLHYAGCTFQLHHAFNTNITYVI